MKKKVKKYQLENPNNARIFIDYRNKKSPVNFQYVGKDKPQKIVSKLLFNLWNRYFLLIPFSISLIFTLQLRILIKNYYLWAFVSFFIVIFIFYFFPILLAYFWVRSKRLLNLIPNLYFNSGRTIFYKEFKQSDVKDNKIEIPLFYNMGLDYEATEDFSRALERVEIVEHDFYISVLKKTISFFPFSNPREEKANEYFWKATFYFSDKIKIEEGSLKVAFM